MDAQQALYFSDDRLDRIADQLADTGYIVIENAIASPILNALHQQALSLDAYHWHEAGVGRDQKYLKDKNIRSDKIHWIDATNEPQSHFLDLMDSLRHGINRRLFMGLFDFESHFSIYEPGQFYQKHIDALKGRSNRVLSSVLYLNDPWQADNGGELLIYTLDQANTITTVIPKMGTMVIFLSEKFPHEVLAAKKTRYSIAGWFRVNGNQAGMIDPAR